MEPNIKLSAAAVFIGVDGGARGVKRIAAADPDFPLIVNVTPRVSVVQKAALERWFEEKKRVSSMASVVRSTAVLA